MSGGQDEAAEWIRESWQLPDKELQRIHREEKATFAKLNQPMTNQEQPGQVSPSGELEQIIEVLDKWQERNDSERQPFFEACEQVRDAMGALQFARNLLLQEPRP